MTEASSDQVLIECSTLSPLQRVDLQAFLERQPEVQSVTRRLHASDALLSPDTQGLVIPRFDLVVHPGVQFQHGSAASREVGDAILRKVAEWQRAHRPRNSNASNRGQ
jgi:hypothetical protein